MVVCSCKRLHLSVSLEEDSCINIITNSHFSTATFTDHNFIFILFHFFISSTA